MAGGPSLPVEFVRAAKTVIQMDQEDNHYKRSKVIQLRDFFWDKVINTMIVLVFGVISVQAIASYFEEGGLKCVIAENHSRSVLEYINQLCYKDLPNYGKFYNILLYAEAALLSGLQLLLSLFWSGRIQSIKSTLASMSLTRNKTTGRFEASDYVLARYLEQTLDSSTALMWTYIILKIFLAVVCLFGIGLMTFYPGLEFTVNTVVAFECYNDTDVNGQWPLVEESVHCVLTELSNIQILRWFNFAALFVIFFAIIIGLIYLVYYLCYFRLVNYKKVATFELYTGLRGDHYPGYRHNCCITCCISPKCNNSDGVRKLISWDMIFLILRLHGTDSKMRASFIQVLTDNHLDYLIKNECSKLPSVETKKSSISLGNIILNETSENFGNVRDLHCILVTSDNESLAYHLASCDFNKKVFKKIICINFNSVISAAGRSKEVLFDHSNTLVYHLPSQIWSVNEKICNEVETHVKKAVGDLYLNNAEGCATVIVLAPLSDEVYRYTHGDLSNTKQRVISLFQHIESVEKVSNCGRTNRLYLLGIVPTKIANEDVRGVFCGGYSYKEKNPDNFKWLTDASTNQSYGYYEWRPKTLNAPERKHEVEGVKYKLIAHKAGNYI